jgi:hypothetical protein
VNARWRKPLIWSAICGIVSSLAIALGASFVQGPYDFEILIPDAPRSMALGRSDSLTKWAILRRGMWAERWKFASAGVLVPENPQQLHIPPWARRRSSEIQLDAFGWPFRSLYGMRRPGFFTGNTAGWMMLPIGAVGMGTSGPRGLAFMPIWSGLLFNAILHTSAWSMLFLGLPALRRARRTRRGLCPACAYDLRNDLAAGCPECGWNKSASSRAPSPEAAT